MVEVQFHDKGRGECVSTDGGEVSVTSVTEVLQGQSGGLGDEPEDGHRLLLSVV